ncbi:MAG TPA: OmpA family protein [Candidatus Limnocylindrales bacterium]|nr:OmpA family protein [Candidatus Limnocylindrales bacterium]
MGLGRVWMRKLSVLSVVVGAGLAIGVLGMASGCSSKKSEDSTSDLTDESLGGGGSGSLSQFNKTGQAGTGGRFEDVYFAYDSADLDGAGTQATRANADLLRSESGKVEIEGHCDDRGTAEYNLALGARRAKSIRDALVALGIKSSRLSTVSYGEELPVCHDASEACWGRNRRGHIVDLTE